MCTVYGDVHVITFDQAYFDYQGFCKYQVAGYCGTDTSLPAFVVNAQTEKRNGFPLVSWLQYVEIVYDGNTIQLGPGSTVTVLCVILVI